MRVGIIAHGSLLERENLDLSIEDLVFQVVSSTLKEHRLTLQEIDTVIQAGDDLMDGIAINHVYTIEPAGAFLKEESKVERDGAWALHYAMARLLSGKFRTALVVAFSKASQLQEKAMSGMTADPFYLRPVGANHYTTGALQARYYAAAHALDNEALERAMAQVAVKNRKNGQKNPRAIASETGDYSQSDVRQATMLSTPLTKLNTAQAGDGCIALVVAREDYIKEKGLEATWLTGVGFYSDAYYPTYRNLSRLESTGLAVKKALQMSGLTIKQIEFMEAQELMAHQELMFMEAAGLCGEGQATAMLEAGETMADGSTPINVSGGALSGHAVYVSGLGRIMEASLQMQGKAGAGQLPERKKALCLAQAGLAAQAAIAYVLEA